MNIIINVEEVDTTESILQKVNIEIFNISKVVGELKPFRMPIVDAERKETAAPGVIVGEPEKGVVKPRGPEELKTEFEKAVTNTTPINTNQVKILFSELCKVFGAKENDTKQRIEKINEYAARFIEFLAPTISAMIELNASQFAFFLEFCGNPNASIEVKKVIAFVNKRDKEVAKKINDELPKEKPKEEPKEITPPTDPKPLAKPKPEIVEGYWMGNGELYQCTENEVKAKFPDNYKPATTKNLKDYGIEIK